MTRNQINRKEMQETVAAYLNEHAPIWNATPMIVTFKTELDNVNAAIDAVSASQMQAQVFLGKTKSQLKKVVAQKADMLNDVIEAYAGVEGDAKLEQRMGASATELFRVSNEDFSKTISEIITAANDRMEELVPYGCSEAMVTDLMNELDDYLELHGQPRMYRIRSSQATESLEALFDQAHELLDKRLDKVMKVFATRNATFYKGYLAARMIVD
ncbi:hypothetical protein [Marinoscillum furvescens]|uniref:Uncharacterized protein n=1 Tax=Marinoscillum furvescens DSM 4134 TaxID=1122208 RepID=A0A3D9L2Y8_MARFU|nr:hypothetical protein [Marinoscillum furvescens]RED96142.1 hypothetical protein C7460_11531 [Marinoscillum furvescens DSM 4134]